MPKTTTITCDRCGADLASTSNCGVWRLALVVEAVPSRGGFEQAMPSYPPLERDAYFCGKRCLVSWVRQTFGGNEVSTPLTPEAAEKLSVVRVQ